MYLGVKRMRGIKKTPGRFEMNALKRHQLQKAQENRPTTIFDLMTRPISDFGLFSSPIFQDEPNFKVDLKDGGDHYELVADLPGVKKDDIKLNFEEGVLSISAETHSELNKKDDHGYVVQERSYGTMQRRFYLADADEQKAEASYENGVLKLTLGKKVPATRKSIAIK